MVPSSPPSGTSGAKSERLLWDELKDGLSDEFFVYSSWRYFDEASAAEGEVDFIILHRERGLLVVECKGHGVRHTGTGRWTRLGPDGAEEPLRESPFAQAQRHVKQLVKKLEPGVARLFPALKRFPLVHGHAVAFPQTLVGDLALPPDAPRELIFDAADLHRLPERLDSLFALYGRAAHGKVKRLDKPAFKKFRKQLLCPALKLAPGMGAALRQEEHAMLRLSEDQAALLESLLVNPTLLVRGAAGTGKTVLALEATRQLAGRGLSVLLLCYNRALGASFNAEFEQWSQDAPADTGAVYAGHFHRLCHAAYHQLGRELDAPRDEDARAQFWDNEAPLVLMEGLEAGVLPRFDALVVDESQDFLPTWWDALDEALVEPEDAHRVVFYDPSQDIFGRSRLDAGDDVTCELDGRKGRWQHATRFPLKQNFRNTRAIAEVVAELGHIDARPHHRCPLGEPPDVRGQQSGRSAARKELDALVRKLCGAEGLLPEQLTLITPHSRPNSCLRDTDELGGLPLADNPADRVGKLLHVTIGAFKGLESEVVIFADVDPTDERCNRFARYVAASRAKHRLHVFSKGDWLAE